MPPTQLLPWLLTALVASVTGMVSGVHSGHAWLSWAAALVFSAALMATSYEINRGCWEPGAASRDPDAAQLAALRNTQLITVAYMWGALALLAVYRLSGLRWQHGVQYGAGMALITFLLMGYVQLLSRRDSALTSPRMLALAGQLAWGHAAACIAGLSFLALSGKLLSSKGDWAANQVFLAGGVAMTVLSVIAAITQQRLADRGRRKTEAVNVAEAHERQGTH